MTPVQIAAILVGTLALVVAGVSGLTLLRRRTLLSRAAAELAPGAGSVLLRPEVEEKSPFEQWLARLSAARDPDTALKDKFVMAGFETDVAPAVYFLVRMTCVVMLPATAMLLVPRTDPRLWVVLLLLAVVIGVILPMAMLDRMVRLRQVRIFRAVPDALDLLVVCVEAGVSLDAAILRVARDLRLVHHDLAHELAVVHRLSSAGMPRDAALRGLWQRTGVEDLRSLVSSMVQSEKWGTSIATVLRVAAEGLRRRRRQAAEKKAKQAALKMTFPLLFFILPALFAVIMGPAVAQIIKEFSKV